MIYITGDTHGDIKRFTTMEFMHDIKFNPEDYLIVCGDFGFIFCDDEYEKMLLNELEKAKPTILWIDGNHENFNVINDERRYSVEEWHGGKVHRIRKNILHLMRGQVFELEGKKVFTMGGAYSVDRFMRDKNISYWEQELPSAEEYAEARKNLAAHNNKVDIILTHTAPFKVITEKLTSDYNDGDEELTKFLDEVMNECEFDQWYFGHWHEDRALEIDVNGKPKVFNAMLFDVLKAN